MKLTCEKVLNPSRMGLYPVHLHRLPEDTHTHTRDTEVTLYTYVPSNAPSICFSEGAWLFLRRVYMDMTKPGVQKPHCDPWARTIRSCMGGEEEHVVRYRSWK